MWFFLGDKFNGSIIFDIRGQHEVLKVKFKVIRVSNTALGAEWRAFMTHRAYINNFWNTLHLVYTTSAPQVLSQTTDNAPQVLSQTTDIAPQVLSHTTDTAPQALSQTMDTAPQVLSHTTDNAPQVLSQTMNTAPQVVTQTTDNAPQVVSQNMDTAPASGLVPDHAQCVTRLVPDHRHCPCGVITTSCSINLCSRRTMDHARKSTYGKGIFEQRWQYFVGRILCLWSATTGQAAVYQCHASHLPRQSQYSTDDIPCHVCHQSSDRPLESWTDSCYHIRPAPLGDRKSHSVGLNYEV